MSFRWRPVVFPLCMGLMGWIGTCQGFGPPRHTLFDAPVSNNGARCRIIIYKKGLAESEIGIVSPQQLGGLKSEEYLKVSPQGKMPALTSSDGLAICESDTIARYLISTYRGQGPDFQIDNPKSNLIARLHDMYLTTTQACLYKPAPPFGVFGTRKDALKEFSRQLYIISDIMEDLAGYACGSEVSLADATLFPTMVFATHMFPKFDCSPENPIPVKIERWFQWLLENDPTFKKVYDEMMGAIQTWDERGRWDKIWRAGARDGEDRTLFDKIIAREIPAEVVLENDKVLAFKDINPAAPAHVLVIPKDRDGLTRLRRASPEHVEILGRLMLAAGEISKDTSLGFGEGSRIVVNDGRSAGQEVFHLHLHVLGGREFSWPPG